MSKCNKRIANQQKYIGNEVVNHKVEQIIRAIVVPNNGGNVFEYLHPVSTCYTIQGMLGALDIVEVGSAVGGWAFHPDTNSALITLGLNPSAVLLRLNSVVIEDVPALVESAGRRAAGGQRRCCRAAGRLRASWAPAARSAAPAPRPGRSAGSAAPGSPGH